MFLLPAPRLCNTHSKDCTIHAPKTLMHKKRDGETAVSKKGIAWLLRGSGHRGSVLVIAYYGALTLLPTAAMNLGSLEPQTSNRKIDTKR